MEEKNYPSYDEFIQNILDTRGRFGITEGYYETHHIKPKCLGGDDTEDNLIDLYASEHYLAHKYLYLEHKDNAKLLSAFWIMSHTRQLNNIVEISKDEYEELKKAWSTRVSSLMKGVNPWERLSAENRIIRGNKISESLKGRAPWNKGIITGYHVYNNGKCEVRAKECPEGFTPGGIKRSEDFCMNVSKNLIGRPVSAATREKIRVSNRGKIVTAPQREKISETLKYKYKSGEIEVWNKGKHTGGHKVSEETKKKMSVARTGITHTEETKRKISDIQKELYASGKKIAWNKGKHMSDEYKKLCSITHKGKGIGRKNTKETICLMKESASGHVWLHKGDKQTHCKKDKVNELLNDGWVIGSIRHKEDKLKNVPVMCLETGKLYSNSLDAAISLKDASYKRIIVKSCNSGCSALNLHFKFYTEEL